MLGCQQVGWLVGLSPWLIGPGERQHTAWRAVCVFLHRTVHVAASVAPRGVSLLSGWNPSRLLGVETTRPVISTCPFGVTRIRIAGDCVRAQEPAGSGVHSPVPWSNVASTVLARTRLDFPASQETATLEKRHAVLPWLSHLRRLCAGRILT